MLQALKVGWLTQSKNSCHGQTLISECLVKAWYTKIARILRILVQTGATLAVL